MTLCWKHVRNKISCVKFFKAILQIKRCRTKFWKDLLESDKLFTYWNMLCSQTSAFLSFLMRDLKCGEGGETDMTASNMNDGVLYKLYCLPTLDKIWLFHMRELCFFLMFLVIPFSLVWSRWDFIGITVTYFMHQLSAIYHLMTVSHFQSNLIKPHSPEDELSFMSVKVLINNIQRCFLIFNPINTWNLKYWNPDCKMCPWNM